MRTTTVIMVMAGMGLASAPAWAGLDCARVRELSQNGSRASDIARTLGITTPDVQACLAGAVEEPPPANPSTRLPLAPQVPQGDGPIRRGPDGQAN